MAPEECGGGCKGKTSRSQPELLKLCSPIWRPLAPCGDLNGYTSNDNKNSVPH